MRWRATAARPIRSAIRSSGCARTIRTKFLESFYFQYGHASIADLGHVVLCFEGISELAATEIEDEQLWDGQARSSRYQDFSKSGFVTPPEFDAAQAAAYQEAAAKLLAGYNEVHAKVFEHLAERLPRPEEMKPEAYQRNMKARAFDVARYLLCFGIPTGVGQVTSIRTLERQVRRLKASEYEEVRESGGRNRGSLRDGAVPAMGCERAERKRWRRRSRGIVDADEHAAAEPRGSADVGARKIWRRMSRATPEAVDLIKPADTVADIVATLLYPVTDRPYRELYEMARAWSAARRNEVLDVALRSRSRRDDLLRNFRGAPYVFDIVMDIGAYRDLHRHRRCQQFRQAYSAKLGFRDSGGDRRGGPERMYTSAACHMSRNVAATLARTRRALSASLRGAVAIPLQDGFRGGRIHRAAAHRREGPLQLSQNCLGNEAKDERAGAGAGRLMEATPPWVEDPLQR